MRLLKTLVVLLLLVSATKAGAQVNPTDSVPGDPGALSVYTIENMSFGAFSAGSTDGTVVISNSGLRSVTGDIIALNMGVLYYQSIFDIDAPRGSVVSVMNGADAVLRGSNGGTMTMHIGSSSPASPFITVVNQPARTSISIGGTLSVGTPAANPPGNYSGTFFITFNQE